MCSDGNETAVVVRGKKWAPFAERTMNWDHRSGRERHVVAYHRSDVDVSACEDAQKWDAIAQRKRMTVSVG